MALVRRLIGGGLAVAVAFAVLLAGFSIFISPDAVRQRVVERATAVTGFDVAVRGQTRLSLFPNLRFELNDIAFVAPGQPDAAPIASAHRLVGGLDLWRLLSGDLVPESLTLVRPRIAIVRAPNGAENWQPGAQGALGRAILGQEGDGASSVRIGRIGIEDGRITYVDGRSGTREEVSSLTGEINWPRLGSWAEGGLSGVWRGEIFNFGFNAPEPLRLLRHGRSGLQVEASAAGARLRFRGQALLEAGAQLNGTMNLEAASVRTLADLLGEPVPPGPGLNELSISGDLRLVAGVVSLTQARIALDDNTAEGSLEVDLGAARPSVRGTLATETLDLNVYRRNRDQLTLRSPGPVLDMRVEPEHLDRVEADVRFSAARVLIGEMTLGRTAGTITSRPGSFVLGIAETGIYGGLGAGTLNLTNDGEGTRWDCVLALDEAEVQPLFQSLVGLDQIRGKGMLRLNASGQGATFREVLGNLSGKGKVEVAAGSLSGFEAQGVARALASGRLVDLPSAGSGTSNFEKLSVALDLHAGAAWIEKLSLEAGALVVEGKGRISLPDTRIEGTAAVRLKDASTGTDAIPEMPLVIRGTLSSPRLYPPPKWLLQQASPATAIDPIGFRVPPGKLLRGEVPE